MSECSAAGLRSSKVEQMKTTKTEKGDERVCDVKVGLSQRKEGATVVKVMLGSCQLHLCLSAWSLSSHPQSAILLKCYSVLPNYCALYAPVRPDLPVSLSTYLGRFD